MKRSFVVVTNRFSEGDRPNTLFQPVNNAVVSQALHPNRLGQVQYRGRWLAAICQLSITIPPDTLVQVVRDAGEYLIVQPLGY